MVVDNDADTILIISLVLICLLLLLATCTFWFLARRRLTDFLTRGRSSRSQELDDSPIPSISGSRRSAMRDEEGAGSNSHDPPPVATRPIEGPPPPYDVVCMDWMIKDKR